MIYIIMIAIAIYFSYLYSKETTKKKKWMYYLFIALPLIIVAAIRYDVGTDYLYRYVHDFEQMKQGIKIQNLEFLFLRVNEI